MSRRILVIDADVGFQRLLRDQLGPYGFDIVIALDGADAMARLPKLQPTLLVISVEEPDKQGFAVFNKAKKGVAANVPIVLATATIPPDTFINHRRLKLHADEYIDKRSLSADELLGKIDNLIGLGEMIIPSAEIAIASDPAMQIPVEVDDVPMELSDGDLVLEETFGEDEAVYHEAAQPPPMSGAGIHILPGQGDDALGDFRADDGGRTGLGGDPIVDEVLSAETDAAFDALVGGDDAQPIGAPPTGAGNGPTSHPPTPTAPATGPRPRSMSAVPEEIAAPDPPRLPILIEPESGFAPEAPEDLIPVPQQGSGAIPQAIGDTRPPPLGPALGDRPLFLDVPTQVEPGLNAIPPPGGIPAAQTKPGGMRPGSVIDLGLDEIAARADEEQTSGVHDRRQLQKVHTLERENARLKTELDKARDGSGKTATGASREFLNLREQISARDKELLELREAAANHERALTEARERLRQIQHAKQVVEAKNAQLEAKLVGDSDRAETAVSGLRSAEARAAEAQARLADVEHAARNEIERMAAAVTRAEKARMEAEAAMMMERGGRDSAIEQERVRALTALRTELEGNHNTVLAMRDQELEEQVSALRAVHNDELAELKDGAARELAQAGERHTRELQQAQQGHARELASVREAHAREIADAQQAYAALQQSNSEDLAAAQQSLVDDLSSVQRELAHTRAALAAAEQASAALQQDQIEALASAGDRHQAELAAAREAHATELAAARETHATELAAIDQRRAQALAASRLEVEAAQQQAAQQIAAAQQQAALQIAAAQQAALQELVTAKEASKREMAAARDAAHRELAATRDEAGTAIAAAEQARSDELAAAQDAHRAELDALIAAHAGELAGAAQALAEAEVRFTETLEGERAAAARALAEAEGRLQAELANVRAAVEDADAQLKAERRALAETRREVEAREAAALADAAASLEAAVAEANRTHAAELERLRGAHHRDMNQEQARRAAALDELRGQHVRALAEKDAALVAAAEDQRKALQAAAAAAAEQAAQLRADQVRALEQADIRLKTQREADRADADRAMASARADHEGHLAEAHDEIAQLEKGLSGQREQARKLGEQIVALNHTVKLRDDEIRGHVTAVTERDKRITELRGEIESLENENASYQEQVLKAYQKIKTDEATVSRAKKALAIALTALDEEKKKDAAD